MAVMVGLTWTTFHRTFQGLLPQFQFPPPVRGRGFGYCEEFCEYKEGGGEHDNESIERI